MKTTIVVLPVRLRIKHNTVAGKREGVREMRDAIRGLGVMGGAGDTHYETRVAGFKFTEHDTPRR